MSDVCATSLVCKSGRAAIQRMTWTLAYLKDQYPNFDASRFVPTVESIQSSLAAIDHFYTDWIPFNPDCCEFESLGNQADVMTNSMLQSVGAANIPPPPPETDWASVIVFGGVALLLIAYQPQISRLFKK